MLVVMIDTKLVGAVALLIGLSFLIYNILDTREMVKKILKTIEEEPSDDTFDPG